MELKTCMIGTRICVGLAGRWEGMRGEGVLHGGDAGCGKFNHKEGLDGDGTWPTHGYGFECSAVVSPHIALTVLHLLNLGQGDCHES